MPHKNPKFLRITQSIEAFLKLEASSGIILGVCALIAMVIANSPWSTTYFDLLRFEILRLSVQHWINDGLMAIFFFVVGMEIKRELVVGELSTAQKASLPIAAALGGMIVPALIYYSFNPHPPSVSGWGIPMATDIAFAIGVLSLFGKRVPLSLKIFLLALAIVDDLGAVLVIAFFYTQKINGMGLGLAVAALGFMVMIKAMGVRSYYAYLLLGVATWFSVLVSGVHATVAGVLIGFLTPFKFSILKGTKETYSPLNDLIHKLHPWVSFGIMPVFALANAGVSLRAADISEVVLNPIYQGVGLGLIFGKPIGIMLFSGLAVWLRVSRLPTGVSWSQVFGTACLGGIGFTMALFISSLALPYELEVYSKTGIIIGSVISGALGLAILAKSLTPVSPRGTDF